MLRLWKNLIVVLFLTLFLGGSIVSLNDPIERVRAYTRPVEFDYVNWTLEALWVKWKQTAMGDGDYVPLSERSEVVLNYIDLVRKISVYEAEVARLYADPAINDPEHASQELQEQINQLQSQHALLAPLAESVFQAQLSSVLAELGLGLGGQPVPPVLYHVTSPPNALIVSPRDTIRQDANISIDPDMSLEDITILEDQVAEGLDVSSLVVGIGGIGLYPTMIMQTVDMNFLAEVVSHEWVHNFLTLRPLGANYLSSPELRVMNETVASIAGKEIGRELIATYYPELLPPPPNPPEDALPYPSEEPPAFDFRAEMHETRVNVDAMLAQGQVDEAEDYMEQRRQFLWDNGYRLRRLNQAYFAFYGAYADQPGGAAGEDPVGAAVRLLRVNSPSLSSFLNRISLIWTMEQLESAVQHAQRPFPGS